MDFTAGTENDLSGLAVDQMRVPADTDSSVRKHLHVHAVGSGEAGSMGQHVPPLLLADGLEIRGHLRSFPWSPYRLLDGTVHDRASDVKR